MGLRAVCIFTSQLLGLLYLNQEDPDKPTNITGEIRGLTAGNHGFHVHIWGDLTEGCKSAGPHYNPRKMTHGGPDSPERHVGDLGNIASDENGVANVSIADFQVQLIGEFSVLGRSLVVHEFNDDLGLGGHEQSNETGSSGDRVGCCVIASANPDITMATMAKATVAPMSKA